MKFTVAYITCREEPNIGWFYDSLDAQLPADLKPDLVVVDHFMKQRFLPAPHPELRRKLNRFVYTPPKPSVWQGPHRLTAVDFFSASNARNTALCYGYDSDYIVYVDDCSVLYGKWLESFMEASKSGEVILGSYEKCAINHINDIKWIVGGRDYRLDRTLFGKEVVCSPRYLLGCTVAIPVSALVAINGWPEFHCDGMGYEDCITGVVLSNIGLACIFVRDMKIFEDEPSHHVGQKMLRIDPGVSPVDKSHTMWERLKNVNYIPQDFGEEQSMLGLKARVDHGIRWPIPKYPTHEWFTGIPLEQFHLYESRTPKQ